jgi:hypothetical protein
MNTTSAVFDTPLIVRGKELHLKKRTAKDDRLRESDGQQIRFYDWHDRRGGYQVPTEGSTLCGWKWRGRLDPANPA